MDGTLLLVLVIVVLVVAVAWLLYERRRSDTLRSRFGPEYRRAVEDVGDRRAAESELEARQRRVDALEIRPLPPADRDRYRQEWRDVQARFVDDPQGAIQDADRLIGEVMQQRGYPVADFEQRVADISVDHPAVVDHYRTAHAIASRADGVGTDTEDLRQAMVHYRALFDDLLGGSDGATGERPANETARDGTQIDRDPTPSAGRPRLDRRT